MIKRLLNTFLILIITFNIHAQGSFVLTGNIFNKNKEAISNVKFNIIAGAKTVNVYESKEDGSFSINLELNNEYKVDIVKNDYVSKRVLINTKVPSYKKNERHELFTLIILKASDDKNENNTGVPISKYYYNELLGNFTGERFKTASNTESLVKNNKEGNLNNRELLERNELIEEAKKLVEEATLIRALAEEYADSIRLTKRKGSEFRNVQNPELSNKIIKEALENSTREISDDDFDLAGIDKNKFSDNDEVKTLKERIDKLNKLVPKSSWDSLNIKKDRLALRKKLLDFAKYQLEVDRLKAITEEDSIKISKRESELYFIQQEMLLAEQEIENANNELHLKNLEISKKNLILVSFAVGILLLLIFLTIVFYFYRDKKRINKLLAFQNLELERLSVVARETSNAIIITDKKGKFNWVNKAYSELFGYQLNEVIGDNAKYLINDKIDENIRTIIGKSLSSGESVNYEFETESKSGNKIWLQSTLTPILDDKKRVSKIVVVDSDISELKKAEQEIRIQNEHISLQNEKIISSITYAKTIQTAILPPVGTLNRHFDSFVIYRPKDIVSGDFYWYDFLPGKNGEAGKHIYAVIDCTGHGVPGAFMSMIGNRLLNGIVREKEITQPGEILEYLDDSVIKALRQEDSENNDGMDVCICLFEKAENTTKVTFSGAKRPLYVYNSAQKNIEQIKGSRRSIGGRQSFVEKESYVNHEMLLQKNDFVYLLSDGYTDQPSPERNRFGNSRLIRLLEKIGAENIDSQKEIIERELIDFQGDAEQRDDITLLGIRV